jgi:hypothetical protein
MMFPLFVIAIDPDDKARTISYTNKGVSGRLIRQGKTTAGGVSYGWPRNSRTRCGDKGRHFGRLLLA